MLQKPIIQTERLILRQWCEKDFKAFAQLNADPRVMKYFPSVLSEENSNQVGARIQKNIEQNGWGLWAVSVPGVSEFIGFIGLSEPTFEAHFTPAIEVGWRLAYPFWGKGYATEGALACLKYAFEALKLDGIVSFTAVQNIRSRSVMERIGMHRDPKEDFDHPNIAKEHILSRLVLYRIGVDEWRKDRCKI